MCGPFKSRHLLGGIRVKIKDLLEISVFSEISKHLFQPKFSIAYNPNSFALKIKKLVPIQRKKLAEALI